MTKSCNILKYLVLTCLMVIAFPALSYSQIHTTRLEPAASLFSLEEGYQVAGIYWLPDYLKDNTSRDYNTNAGNNDQGGGDPWTDNEPADGRCGIYGFKETSAVDTYLYDCDVKHPVTGMTCYDNCVCKPKFQYTSSNCTAASGKVVSGRSCGGKYESCVCKPTVSVGTGENCDISCNGNCVQKSCKSSVSVGTGEECSERCASNTGICTAKRCKASVSVGTGEECSERCASNSGICTAKRCKSSVSYNSSTGEYCAEKCASNSGVCTKKGCNKICKDEYTGSIPSNGYATTKTCSDCSGSYTVKTGWACNSGYHASGSSCIADCTRSCYDSYTGSLPANAQYTTKTCSDCSGSYVIKTGWACNSGYTKSGNSCVKDCANISIMYYVNSDTLTCSATGNIAYVAPSNDIIAIDCQNGKASSNASMVTSIYGFNFGYFEGNDGDHCNPQIPYISSGETVHVDMSKAECYGDFMKNERCVNISYNYSLN